MLRNTAPDGSPLTDVAVYQRIKLDPRWTLHTFKLREEQVKRALDEKVARKVPYYGEDGRRKGFLWGFRYEEEKEEFRCDVAKSE